MAELSKETLERASKHIQGLYTEYSKKCSDHNEKVKQYHTTWKNEQDNKLVNDISNCGILETHSVVEIWTPRIFSALYPFRMFFDFEGELENKEKIKKYYRRLLDKMKWESKEELGIRNFCIEGTVWYKIYQCMDKKEVIEYEYEEIPNWSDTPFIRNLQEKVVAMGGKEPTMVQRKEKRYFKPFDAPMRRLVPSELMIYDYDLNDPDDMTWVEELVEIRPSTMVANKDVYINQDLVKSKILDGYTDEQKDLDAPIKCIEYHGLFDINNDGEPVLCLITKPLDYPFVIRATEHPNKDKELPYTMTRFLPVKNRLPGMGIPELIQREQAELDSKRNLISVAETLESFNETIVGTNVKFKQKNSLENPAPGKIHYLIGGTVADIKPRERNVHIDGALALQNTIKAEIREATKATPTMSGVVKGGETTAFEVSSAMREGNQSIKFVIERYTMDIVEAGLRKVQSLVEQYVDDNEVFTVDGGMITAMDIKKASKLRAIGLANMEQEALDMQTAINLHQAATAVPVLQDKEGNKFYVSTKDTFMDLMKSYKKDDIEKYIGVTPIVEQPMMEGGEQPGATGNVVGERGGNPLVNSVKKLVGGMFKSKKVGG